MCLNSFSLAATGTQRLYLIHFFVPSALYIVTSKSEKSKVKLQSPNHVEFQQDTVAKKFPALTGNRQNTDTLKMLYQIIFRLLEKVYIKRKQILCLGLYLIPKTTLYVVCKYFTVLKNI